MRRGRLAVVGGGWAGLAAAVAAVRDGQRVCLFEGSRQLGGRARELSLPGPSGAPIALDNGQHILIGAYRQTLGLMQSLGVDLGAALRAQPLGLPFADGGGLQTPAWAQRWPDPLGTLAAICNQRGWPWSERWALLRSSLAWRAQGFACPPERSVAELCDGLPQRVLDELIEPLCVSALNIPMRQASGAVFLRVLGDALNGAGHAPWRASDLLLPRWSLSALLPQPALAWLQAQGPAAFELRLGWRVQGLKAQAGGWCLSGAGWEEAFEQVIWATPAPAAANAMQALAHHPDSGPVLSQQARRWGDCAAAIGHTAIATCYLWHPDARLSAPMLALRPPPPREPDRHGASAAISGQANWAQFAFDRGAIKPEHPQEQGLLALVVSASGGDRQEIEANALRQAQALLPGTPLRPLQTVLERRATFACTPGLVRPACAIAPGLAAAGDYTDGPYPATLEAAVQSGQAAWRALG